MKLFLCSISFVLLLQIRLLLFTNLLIDLCASRWLVTMRLCYSGSILLVQLVVLGEVGVVVFVMLHCSVSDYCSKESKYEYIRLLRELVCWQWSADLWGRLTDGCSPCLRGSELCRRRSVGYCRRLVLKT
jgi:hypothetical protein